MADKNFLGLGVVFKGMDDGLDKTIKKVVKNTEHASMKMDLFQKSIDNFTKKQSIDLDKILPMKELSKEMALLQSGAMQDMMVEFKRGYMMIDTMKDKSDGLASSYNMLGSSIEKTTSKYSKKVGSNVYSSEQLTKAFKTNAFHANKLVGGMEDVGDSFDLVAKIKDALIENFKGFDKKIEKSEKQVQQFGRSNKKFGKGMNRIFNPLSPFTLVANLSEVSDWLKTIARGVEVDQMSMQFDDLFQRMSLAFDTDQIDKFRAATLDGMRLGVMAEDAYAMSRGLASFGMNADRAMQILPTMQEMVGILGMDAEHVATMFGEGVGKLQIAPKTMVKLTKEFQKVGRAYGFIRPLEGMPEIIKSVVDSTFVLGKTTRQQAPAMALSIMKVAGSFKSLGLSQKDAMQKAMGFSEVNVDMLEQLQRMAVGLDFDRKVFTDFATEIAIATGRSEQEILGTFQKIGTDSEKMIAYLQKAYREAQGQGDNVATRFALQMKKLYGKDVAQAITTHQGSMQGAVKAAEEQEKQLGSSEQAWKNSIEIMEKSLKVSDKMNRAMESLLKVTADLSKKELRLTVDERYRKEIGNLVDMMGKGESKIMDFALTARTGLSGIFEDFGFETLSKIVSKMGAWGALMGALIIPVFGSFTKILMPLARILKGFGGTITGLVKPLGAFLLPMRNAGQAASGLSFGLKGLTKAIGKVVVPLGVVLSFLDDIPKALQAFKKGDFGDGILTLILGKSEEGEGLETMFNQMFKFAGIGMLLGGPIGAAIGAAIGGLASFVKSGLERGFGNIWDEVIGGLANAVGKLDRWLEDKFNKLLTWVMSFDWSGMYDSALNELANAGEAAWNSLKDIFEHPGEVLGKLHGFIGTLAIDLVNTIKSVFEPVYDYISKPFIDAYNYITGLYKTMNNRIVDSFTEAFPNISVKIKSVWDGVSQYTNEIWQGIKNSILDKIVALSGKLSKVPILGKMFKEYVQGLRKGKEAYETLDKGLRDTTGKIGAVVGSRLKKTIDFASKEYKRGFQGKDTAKKEFFKESAKLLKEKEEYEREQAKAKPTQSQPQAPRKAPIGQVMKPTTGDEVSFNQMTNAIDRMRRDVIEQLKKVAKGGEVNVTIEGDMRKFLKVVKTDSNEAMGDVSSFFVPG